MLIQTNLHKAVFFSCFIILATVTGANAEAKQKFEVLLKEEVLPIEGKECGCMAFPRQGPLTKTNVIFSTESSTSPAFIRIEGKTHTFSHYRNTKEKSIFVNEYRNSKIKLKMKSREVSYSEFCSSYTSSPSEGSCFLGTLIANTGVYNIHQEVVILCGCPGSAEQEPRLAI